MADKPGAKPPAKGFFEEFGWFIWGLIGLGFLWFFMGGYERQVISKPFIKPAAPLDSGQTYGKTYVTDQSKEKETLDLPKDPITFIREIDDDVKSFFLNTKKKELYFENMSSTEETEVQKEYITLVANTYNKEPINISGSSLQGDSYDTNVKIGQATEKYVMGIPYQKSNIVLKPGEKAIINSGKSPVGTSFKTNICTGYMDQFQTYSPVLDHKCPKPADELKLYGPYNEKSCLDFVETIPRCRVYNGKFPTDISASCKSFVIEKLNYNSCVKNHEKDNNFEQSEWRVFLGQIKELWKDKKDVIKIQFEEKLSDQTI